MKWLGVVLVLVAGVAQAQCPAADSLFGRGPREYKSLKVKYDDFTDTTSMYSGIFYTHPMNGDPAVAVITTSFAGKALAVTDSGLTLMTVRVEKMGGGGMMGGNNAALTTANAHFADVKEAQFKFKNGTRLRVPLVSNKPTLEAAGVLIPQKLVETLTFKFAPADRIVFANGGSGEMRFGDYVMGFDEEQTERDMSNSVRYLVCGGK